MKDRVQLFLQRYADPRYLKWLLILLGLVALVLGAGAPDGWGTGGG